jgi:hypothetical protein
VDGASFLSRLRDGLPWLELAAVLTCAIAAARLLHRVLRRRRGPLLPTDYAAALRLLARRGLVRSAPQTARDFLAAVEAAHPGAAASAFESLTQGYLAHRFGGRPVALSKNELCVLRKALKRRNRAGSLYEIRQTK